MASQISAIGALLFSAALFLIGNGLIGTLTPLRAHLEGFSELAIGALGAWYYLGFLIGCLTGPKLLARAGHIRAFAVAASLTAVSILVQAMAVTPASWFVLRCATGFGMPILYMVVESWLNDIATNATRGALFSLYLVVNFSAILAGQWFLLIAGPASFEIFSIAALFFCLCVAPIGMTRLSPPQASAAIRVNLWRIFAIAPVGGAGCLTVGLANSAFWALAPLYAQSLGFSTGGIALFMSVFIAGGALVQWPVGRLSDAVDRRWIIGSICLLACVTGLALGLGSAFLTGRPAIFYGLVFALGVFMLPLYSLSVAHTNDRLTRPEFVEAAASLLMLTAATSIPGPFLAAFLISRTGPNSLFLFTACVHAAMALFAITRIGSRSRAPAETRDIFTPVLQSSPAALPLDPRGPAQDKNS